MARPSTISTDQILDAAREVFLESGFRATTAQVAKRARVAEGSIFKRFPTKQELFLAAMQTSIQDPPFLHALPGRAGKGDVRENLVEFGAELMEFLRRMLPLIMMSWSHSRGDLPPHLATKDPPPVRALRKTAAYLAAEMKLGRLRRQDPENLARALFGGVQNYVFHELIRKHHGRRKSSHAYVRGLVDLLWTGAAPVKRKGGTMKAVGLGLGATLAALLLPAPAGAVTLERCLELARAHAPALAEVSAQVSRAQSSVAEARAARKPTLRLDASYVQYNEPAQQVFNLPGAPPGLEHQVIKLGSSNLVDVKAQARYALYSGGRDPALVKAAQAGESAQRSAQEQADADLALRVAQAYYEELGAKRVVQSQEEALASARTHLRVSRARVQAGVSPKLDALRADVDESEREVALVRAQESLRLARVQLENEMGVELDPADSLDSPPMPDATLPDSTNALAQALASRPEISVLDRQIEQASHQVSAARAGKRPQINVLGTAEYKGPNIEDQYVNLSDQGLKTYFLSAGLELNLPIFDGGLKNARVSQQQAQQIALEARRRSLALAVERDLSRAYANLHIAAAEWESNESRIASASEALRLAEASYKGGTGTATDVRDALTSLADARAEEGRSLTNYWSARADLDHAIGKGR